MAVFMQVSGKMTKPQYEETKAGIDWSTNPPIGLISHSAAFDDAGNAHIVDIWETQEDMLLFFESHLMPVFQRLELELPKPQIHPLHNLTLLKGSDKYKV